MKRIVTAVTALLLAVMFLPWESALAVLSTDTAFRNGEQAYMLKIGGMDGSAYAYEDGTPITTKMNARTVQDWAEGLKDEQAAGLMNVCAETLDNCYELRNADIPAMQPGDYDTLGAVEKEVDGYLDALEPIDNWLDWCVEKLDYNRQRVDFLIRQYNSRILDDADKAEIVRDCRTLTEETLAIIEEISQKQAATESALDALEAKISMIIGDNAGNLTTLDPATAELVLDNKRLDELTGQMDGAAAAKTANEESSYMQSQGKDIEVQVLASDEWAALVYTADSKPAHLQGVTVKVTSEDKTITKEGTTDADGKAVFKYTDFKPKGSYAVVSIEFTMPGYRRFVVEKAKIFGSDGMRVTMTKDNGSPYIISASFNSAEFLQYNNIFYTTAENNMTHTIALRVDTKGKKLKVDFNYYGWGNIVSSDYINGDDVRVEFKNTWCDGKTIRQGSYKLCFYLTQSIINYETYMIPARFEKSTIAKPQLEKSNAISFSPGAALGIPEDLLKMGKLDFALDIGIPEVSVMADVGGKFYLAIGEKLKDLEGKDKDNEWKSRSQKEQDDKIKELTKDNKMSKVAAQQKIMKEDYASKKTKFLGDGSININFYGAGVGSVKGAGDGVKRVTLDAGGAVSLNAKISFTWQFFIPTPFGPIPAFFGLDFGVGAMFYADFGVQFDYPGFKNFAISSGTGFTIDFTVTIGATLGIGHAKIANIYGRIYGTAGIEIYIGKTQRSLKMTLGWGWEIGIQIFLLKISWKNGPWSKSFDVHMSNSMQSGISEYAVAKALTTTGTDNETCTTTPITANACDFYPEFGDYMDNLTSSYAEPMDGAGTSPTEKLLLMGDISTVGQEIKYLTIGGTLFGFWITPNCEHKTNAGVTYKTPKLVWVNVNDAKHWGVIDSTDNNRSRKDAYDIGFDVNLLTYNKNHDRDRVLCVVASAPIAERKDDRLIYNTSQGRLVRYSLYQKNGDLIINREEDVNVGKDAEYVRRLLNTGYMYVAPTINATYIPNKDEFSVSVMYCMEKVNEVKNRESAGQFESYFRYHLGGDGMTFQGEMRGEFDTGLAWDTRGGDNPITYAHANLQPAGDEKNPKLKMGFTFYLPTGAGTLEDTNIISAQPLYDANGLLTGVIYLQRDKNGLAKLKSATYNPGTGKSGITDYDIVVSGEHFKVSAAMKSGNYYVYWVEQSKGVPTGFIDVPEPKYTVKCCVYDASETLFSPVFTLLQTDVEVATADFQFVGDKMYMFCIAPNSDSKTFGALAYVRGQLYRYDFNLKGAVDLIGASPVDPVIGAGMDNDILVQVTNAGNLPVSKFGVNVYHYDSNNNKVFLKSFEIDCVQEQNSQINEFNYDQNGAVTIVSKSNADHQVYQVPCTGDEEDVKFINVVTTEYSSDGVPGDSTSKPKSLKILMPGYERMYKFTMNVPKDWRGKKKLYVEISQVCTVDPGDFMADPTRNAQGELIGADGALIPEYMLGFNAVTGETVFSAVALDGTALYLGKVQDEGLNGANILTSRPEEALIDGYNDLWIDVDQHAVNGVEYTTVTIGNRQSDGVTPDEPPTLIVTTDGAETFRHTFKKSVNGNYSYLLDVPTFELTRRLAYTSMVLSVVNGDSYNELDPSDNTFEILRQDTDIPAPTPTPPIPPITGDASDPALWSVLAAVSLSLIALLVIALRAARRKEE